LEPPGGATAHGEVYFDNDQKSAAPKDALRLASIVKSLSENGDVQPQELRSNASVGISGESSAKERLMPRGDKSSYTSKQKRKAEHIEEGYEKRGVSHREAERRAWATVNKESGGGKKSGSGRGKSENRSASRKGGRLGGRAAARRPAAARATSARKAARTRQRRASR
jgi:plasmid stabilization system protein ParE